MNVAPSQESPRVLGVCAGIGGLEREPEYLRIAEARIKRAKRTEPETFVAADGARITQHTLFASQA